MFTAADSMRVGEARSFMASACNGVPQGSVLGTLLFLVFTDDLAEEIKHPSFLFADDAKSLGNLRGSLVQTDQGTVCVWSSKWGVATDRWKVRSSGHSRRINHRDKRRRIWG